MGFILAIAAPAAHRVLGRASGWVLGALPAGLFIYFLRELAAIQGGGHRVVSHGWVPSLGVELSFLVDGLSLLFALMITGTGALVVVYSGRYLAGHRHLGRFYAYLLMFMASMLGIVLANNIISLFIFWELTSFSSYLLIGFKHDEQRSRQAARMALLVTGLGGLALMAGLLLMGQVGGSLELSELLGRGEELRAHGLYGAILVLVVLGAFTKSAQFPFHFWLPNAMEAPTPVSAYLHSATMVKAGIYLLARLSPALGGTQAWMAILTATGALTMVLGAWLAIQQVDLKRLLAYSTLAVLGLLTMLLGLGVEAAVKAAVLYLLVHSLYKGALFLISGNVDHATGSRDAGELRGLRRAMPWTCGAALLAGLSMAGLPPFFGFIGKESFYAAVMNAPAQAGLLVVLAVVSMTLMFVVAGVVGFRIFMGPVTGGAARAHEAPRAMWVAPVLLGLLGLLFGLFPGPVERGLLAPAAAAVLGHPDVPVPLDLALFHGLNWELALSVLTVAAGIVLYRSWDRVRAAIGVLERLHRHGPARWYEWALQALDKVARVQTLLLQCGSLPVYVQIVLIVGIVAIGVTWGAPINTLDLTGWRDVRLYEFMIVLVMVLATCEIIRTRSRLTAIISLGVVGYCIALIFQFYGAPDLAVTQFAIETLSVVLFVLVLYRLPRFARLTAGVRRGWDALVAVSFGALMTGLLLTSASKESDSHLSRYFAQNSVAEAKGHNIVNVILVDFRALDTLGEITVLAVAAIGVFALLKLRLEKARRRCPPNAADSAMD